MCRSGDIPNVFDLADCRGDIPNLFISCPDLADCRADFLHLLKHALPQAGVGGAHLRDLFLQHFLLHRSEALCLLLGSQPEFPACPVAMDQELYDEQCGKAAWLLDKVSKNYIVRCWRVRQSMIGTITIGEGKLVQSPPCSLPTWTGKVSLRSAGWILCTGLTGYNGGRGNQS